MLWIKLDLLSGPKYVSTEAIATVSHFYEPLVISFRQFKFSIDKLFGGYVRPQFAIIDFLPETFKDDWPPPKKIYITVYLYEESYMDQYITLIDGIAVCQDDSIDSISYQIYERDFLGRFTDHSYDNVIAGQTGLFVYNVPNIDPNLTSNYALGDDVNAPQIYYTDPGDQLVLDSLSKTCAVGTHMFYRDIFNNNPYTMVLVDMFADNGVMDLTEFDYFSVDVRYNAPYANYRCGDTSVAGSISIGKDISINPVFNTQDLTEITKGLNRIKQILEMPQITLKLPITNIPNFGQRINIVSESRFKTENIWMRVRNMVFDFDNDQITVTGEGEVS